jgi:hypothetical protein
MHTDRFNHAARKTVIAALLAGAAFGARADVVTDWNIKANEIVVESKLGTPPAIRVMAYVQTAVLGAVESAGKAGAAGASLEAAVAAANRTALLRLLPNQQASIDTAYQAALAAIPDGAAKASGIAAGERAAAAVFAQRAADVVAGAETYRPHTTAGAYVPTAAPAAVQWSQRAPWLMASSAQFRPGPPPALASAAYAREYDEVKELGARGSSKRSAEQTEIGRFWEYSLPPIYYGVARSVASQPGRDPQRNARLLAATAQALDDALIAVFEAKYHYNFWRPSTAIRNGDIDGNDATARDASWTPLIDAPMHPEYPSGHAILAGALGAVLKADIGGGPTPLLATTSPTAKGATRRWTSVDDFVREVADSRIYAGIHFRSALDASTAMGGKIGALAVDRLLQSPE